MASQYSAQTFIEAIPGTGGIISSIARKVGCEWETVKSYIDKYPTVKRAYDAECEAMLDLAESKLLASIKDGDTADAKWYLTKKGKRRGYGDAVEVSGPNGGAIQHQVFDHGAAVAAIAGRSGGYRGESGADEDNRDGA